MGPGTVAVRLRDHGFASVEFLLASALSLLVFFMLANLMVMQYGRAAVSAAVFQAAREGSVTGSTHECEARAVEVIGQVLGGFLGEGVDVGCSSSGDGMIAKATADFDSWIPLVPDFHFEVVSRAVIEPAP